MDGSGGVLLKREGLHDQELARGGLVNVYQFVYVAPDFEQVGVGSLADLAFEGLPINTGEDLIFLFLLLLDEPGLEAVVVDEAYRASTLAGYDARVLDGGVAVPAEPALDLLPLAPLLLHILSCDHLHGLLELLLIQFLLRLLHPLTGKVLDSKLDPSQLDDIELLNFIVLSGRGYKEIRVHICPRDS